MKDKNDIKMGFNYTVTKILPGFWEEFGVSEESLSKKEKSDLVNSQLGKSKFLKTFKGHNLVPSVLRNSFATLISGTDVTPTFKANYLGLGTDATSPTNEDTKLGAEIIRDQFTNRYSVGNVAYLDIFFTKDQLGTNTILEVGTFVDGTASVDTGFLFSRININETFTGVENLSINVSFTIEG